MHSNFLGYACYLCPKRYTQGYALRKHLKWMHRESYLQSLNTKHTCKQCRMDFIDVVFLMVHNVNCHMKLQCQYCKKLIFRGEFAEHTETHAYVCVVCENKYYSFELYHKHVISIHPDELPVLSTQDIADVFNSI